MTPELSRRLGRVWTQIEFATSAERARALRAAESARSWGDLPPWLRAEVEKIEKRVRAGLA